MERQGLLSRTILSYVSELLAEAESWSSLHLLVSRYEGIGEIWEQVGGSSKHQKLFNTLMDAAQGRVAEKGSARQLVSDHTPRLISVLKRRDRIRGITYQQFRRALHLESYDIVGDELLPYPSGSVDVSGQRGKLETLLERPGLQVARGHWGQVTDNLARGNWASANSQIRSFLESVFDHAAAARWKGPGTAPKTGQARKFLQEGGYMSEEEGDLVEALFKVLHTQGSHSGLSGESDCHRRLLMVMGVALYWLQAT